MTSTASTKGTVLVVDDDRTFCATLASSLRRRGFNSVLAHNFTDAAAEAHAWKPERAIVDLRMPGPDGLQTVAALLAADPKLRIVVLTGYGSIATAVEAIKLGAVHYLTKPASLDEILRAFEGGDGIAVHPVTSKFPPAPPSQAATVRLNELEWEHLQRVLTEAGGNVSEAARRLGMHRRSLQRKLARGRPPARDDSDPGGE